MRRLTLAGALGASSLALVAGLLSPQTSALAATRGGQPMFRCYNPNSGEHFYTASCCVP
jgi:hypothetical protein